MVGAGEILAKERALTDQEADACKIIVYPHKNCVEFHYRNR